MVQVSVHYLNPICGTGRHLSYYQLPAPPSLFSYSFVWFCAIPLSINGSVDAAQAAIISVYIVIKEDQ